MVLRGSLCAMAAYGPIYMTVLRLLLYLDVKIRANNSITVLERKQVRYRLRTSHRQKTSKELRLDAVQKPGN